MTIKNRLTKLEKTQAASTAVVYDIRLVNKITPEMRQAQSEAHAGGQVYYIIEPEHEGES